LNIRIREGDVEADGERIASALTSYLTPHANRARFDWLYKRNPHGKVRVWLAIDADREIIGSAAAFPRRLYTAQEEKTGWVFGDFCVSDRYRSLGPALLLQRALLQAVNSEGVALGYDFPSAAMMAIYKRLGVKPAGRMIRLAKPLRADRIVRRRIKSEALAAGVSALANILLSIRHCPSKKDSSISFDSHDRRCDEEFTLLAERLGSLYGHCVRRCADYLNWRYLENPYCKLRMITARRRGRLVGFTVFAPVDQDGVIVDLFGENEPPMLLGLVQEASEHLKELGAMTLSAELMESHPWVPVFRRAGFLPRDEKPLVVYRSAIGGCRSDSFTGAGWCFMGGDRDS
jgi:GNAT superfamily N-acetyltransferase